jgi:16S rRNA C967 or C1407 C5-methylase (RsmB/RsmF family)
VVVAMFLALKRTCFWRNQFIKSSTFPIKTTIHQQYLASYSRKSKMGRGGKNRGGNKQQQETGEQQQQKNKRDDARAVWKTVDLKSDDNAFVRYYGPNGLNLLRLIGRSEEEWPKMLASLRTKLPSTFRVSPCGNFEKRTLRSLNQLAANIAEKSTFPIVDPETGEVIADGPPRVVGPWCPEAWTSGTFRAGLKSSDPFKHLHRFLVRASETGAVSRQELVSMVPAIVLDVKPGNWVLDMCAAPGSKSLQILEFLDKNKERGVLVANDVDSRRAYMLTKRTKNLKSASLVVTTHDGTQFPVMRHKDGSPIFDRVLCDVPCSGDGTVRKNLMLWNQLKVKDGSALHPTQLKIASRAIMCIKLGGTVVYSTCSFNPIEDEAVVCELLKLFKDEIELVDVSAMLPGLVRAPGVSQPWKVPIQRTDSDPVQLFSTFEEYQVWNNAQEKPLPDTAIRSSMFPPANLSEMNMDRCIRLLPHDQDSGGFFVAAFRKTKDVHAEKRASTTNSATASTSEITTSVAQPAIDGDAQSSQQATTTTSTTTAIKPSRKPLKNNKNDVWYEDISEEVWNAIKSEWGLEGVDKRCLQIRMDNRQPNQPTSTSMPNKISWINKDVLELFEISSERSSSLHIVHAGVLAFQRGKGVTYRIANDYASLLLPFVTKRVIEISFTDLKDILDALQAKGHIVEHDKEEGELEDGELQVDEEEDDEEEADESKASKKQKMTTEASKEPFDANILVSNLSASQVAYAKTLSEGGLLLKLNAQDQVRFGQDIGGLFAVAAYWGSRTQIRLMVERNELVELLVQLRDAKLI